ncbi:CBS domain-containing protein [Aetokthonos hydrillicola Thurmond2011]|jgi:two-component sensor histidine kinase/CBS domain-containing protein|uniref:histidine kinase n=1 Tax=Aetokthonos hydrillicola Thurmond2011 TaxID=2712845 RepID=A0AAP5I5M5_9CYAN|nr:histidine kinase dimerization/phosphoacceptor domain -containing protein [Aetokthonos hydrillicola]MBO3458562.1 CBS domain-containing protein [Aetokthonos hydrillicola CCALA 1050]MBW4585005.1 CBS domain-containing protein [Aetokthonos hydrillicola CCALA 1050]MDR9894234.1 CBS domain-containing protein [Aetokthonos hydrillicola Thurmond2011]
MYLLDYIIRDSILTVTPDTSVVEIIDLMAHSKEENNLQIATVSALNDLSSSHVDHKPSLKYVRQQPIDCVLVMENAQLLGIFTPTDVVRLVACGKNFVGVEINEVMREPVMTSNQNLDVKTTLHLMIQDGIRHLAIVDEENKFLGIVTPESLATGLETERLSTKEQMQQEKIVQGSFSDTLEKQITERTQELVKANKLLQRGICDRIAIEAHLLQTTSELQELFQAFPDIYFRLNSDGTVLSCHARETTDLYLPPKDFLGKRMQDVLPDDIAKKFQEAILHVNDKNSLVSIEYSLPLILGSKSFEARLFPSIPNQIIIIVRDITEQKQAQDALQKAKDDLEIRVEERTCELKNTNALLRQEIVERQRAERQLKMSLEEKDVLLKEIHHRVKNNLQIISSLLRLQAGYLKDEQVVGIFQDSQNRIRAMAMIHENLYQSDDLARIDFSDYIRNLTNNLIRSYSANPNINFKLNFDKISLRIDTAIPCGLIINELISNSLKHAFPNNTPGEISIDFSMIQPGRYLLNVSDNGVGITENIEFYKNRSLGLQLVWRLVEQIEGNIEFNNKNGTYYKINFIEQK